MTPKTITIHCSASKNGVNYSIDQMEKDHILKNFGGIAYHLVIQPDGTCHKTRPLNIPGSHVKDHNTGNIGICLVGNDKFTPAQWDQLRYQLDQIRQVYNILNHELYCHYEWDSARMQGKTCPNFKINQLLCWYIGHDYKAIEKNILTD